MILNKIPSKYDFLYIMSFEVDSKIYFLIQNLEKYCINTEFVFENYYKENYIIYDYQEQNNLIQLESNVKILGYIKYNEYCEIYDNIELLNKFDYTIKNGIFFVEGLTYDLYDNKLNKIYTFKLNKKFGAIGFIKIELPFIKNIGFNIFPAKPGGKEYILNMLLVILRLFPNLQLGNITNFEYNKKKQIIPELLLYLNQLFFLKEKEKKKISIKKSQLANYIYDVDDIDLELQIIKKGGFEKIKENEKLVVKINNEKINIKPNKQILSILKGLNHYFESGFLKNLIKCYENNGIKPCKLDNIDIRLQNYLPTRKLYETLLQLQSGKNDKLIDMINNESSNFSFMVGSFTELFEIYSFIIFYNFLKNIGIEFYDNISKIFNKQKQSVEKYDEGKFGGIISGLFDTKVVRLCFGEKLVNSNFKFYKMFDQKLNLKYINKNLGGIDKNGLSPDITLKIGNTFFIGDVKFSSFRNINNGIYYPNPIYYNKLKKYRQILIDDKLIKTPIIIFYPGLLSENVIKDFQLLFDYLYYGENILLFPIGIKNDFNNSIYDKIRNILLDLINK